jgi:hypothetical protein
VALASIAQDVQHFSKKLGLSTDLAIIEHAWNLELGHLRELVRIAALDNASLIVEVESHSVMQEISLRRKELVRKLNKHLPVPFLQHIHVRIQQHHG